MTPLLAILLVGLVIVAFVHTRSRLLGSIGAAGWCVLAVAHGVIEFQTRDELVFLGMATRPWIYFGFIAAIFVFNCAMIVRMWRLKNAGNAAAGKAPR